MSELVSKIGPFDAATRTVHVTFAAGDILHKRRVNAVLKPDGKYDAKGTKERVAEVSRGVAEKIILGVIVQPPVEEEREAGSA